MSEQSRPVSAEQKFTLPQRTPDNEILLDLDEFLEALKFRDRTPVHFRAISPRHAPKKIVKQFTFTRRELREDPQALQFLRELNKTLGVFLVVNKGGNKAKEITSVSAFFSESDTGTIAEQHERLDRLALRPSIRVETKKSVHAYWLIEGPCSLEEWDEIQRNLISHTKGDRTIKDRSRCMRLPGFDHLSINESGEVARVPVRLERFEDSKRYGVEQIEVSL